MKAQYPPPSALLKAEGLRPRRSLGQNFLSDPGLAKKFVSAAARSEKGVALEIGPGLGHLTVMLAGVFDFVVALEKDPTLVELLHRRLEGYGNVQVVKGDAVELDINRLTRRHPGKPVVVGNLPYMITTPVVLRLYEQREHFQYAVIGLQREVAERMCAKPGTRGSGRLTVLLAAFMKVERLFDLPPQAYVPRPKVWSTAVRIEPLVESRLAGADEGLYRQVVAAVFGQRRKTLKRALAGTGLCRNLVEAEACLKLAGIDSRRRGESLTIEELAELTKAVARTRP